MVVEPRELRRAREAGVIGAASSKAASILAAESGAGAGAEAAGGGRGCLSR